MSLPEAAPSPSGHSGFLPGKLPSLYEPGASWRKEADGKATASWHATTYKPALPGLWATGWQALAPVHYFMKKKPGRPACLTFLC